LCCAIACVLDDGATRIAIVALDAIGWTIDDHQAIKKAFVKVTVDGKPAWEKARAQGYGVAKVVLDAVQAGKLIPSENPVITTLRKKITLKIENTTFILAAAPPRARGRRATRACASRKGRA
jgi:hypothetical protein